MFGPRKIWQPCYIVAFRNVCRCNNQPL
jgi:hypothetical protein